MAHNITKRDKQEGTEMGWHNLTIIKPFIDVNNNWLTEWDIEKRVLKYISDEGDVVDTNFNILIGSDDKQVIGKPMAPSYSPISNSKFLKLVSDAIEEIDGAKIESVGSVCNRGKVFVSVSIEDYKEMNIGDRRFENYLNFGNAHDQSSKLWVNNTNICTVCDNTFTFNLNSKSGKVASTVHRGDVDVRLDDVTAITKEFILGQEYFKTKFQELLKKYMPKDRAAKLFAGYITRNKKKDEVISKRAQSTVDKLVDLFENGPGNTGRNYADVFSAITDYYTHYSTRGNGKDPGRQYVSSEFGIGRMNKNVFWNIINDEEQVEKMVAAA